MALGPQFENTYWNNEDGSITSSILNPNKDTYGMGKYHIHQTSENLPLGGTQGMLFSPETGTGTRKDPLVPHSERIAAIQKGLSMSDPVEYAKRAGAKMSGRGNSPTAPPIGKRAANTAINAYTEALDLSSMPTNIIINHIANDPVLAVANTNMTRGHISKRGGVIRLPLGKRYTEEITPEHTVTRTVPTGDTTLTPIFNPNLRKQTNSINWNSEDGAVESVNEVATITSPDGAPFMKAQGRSIPKMISHPDAKWGDKPPLPKIPNPEYKEFKFKTSPKAQAVMDKQNKLVNNLDFRDLPEGYSMNVFPGKGATKNPNIKTEDFAVYNGDTDRTFHTRHAVDGQFDTVTETIPEKTVYKKTPAVSTQTTVHELGHHMDQRHLGGAFDQRRIPPNRSDMVTEGVADGVADAYSGYTVSMSRRMFEQGDTGKHFKGNGYGTEYSGFSNTADKALYAAVRAHVAANPNPTDFNDLPSREALYKKHFPESAKKGLGHVAMEKSNRNNASKLLLGHMYDQHEHVRNTLKGLGMEDVGKEAHALYKETDPNRYKGPEQESFPGM